VAGECGQCHADCLRLECRLVWSYWYKLNSHLASWIALHLHYMMASSSAGYSAATALCSCVVSYTTAGVGAPSCKGCRGRRGPRSNAPLLYCLCMLVMLSLSVARSLWRRYDLRAAILPVLWMASYLHKMVQRVTSVRCRVQARRRCCVVNWLSCPKWWRVPPRKGCRPPRRSLQSTIRLYMSPMHSLNHFEESNVIIIKGE